MGHPQKHYTPEEIANIQRARYMEMQKDILEFESEIYYSPRYNDDVYEYRHVSLPPRIARWAAKDRLLADNEWRALGIKQSLGWVHYMLHKPEPHVLMFRREKDYQLKYPEGKPSDVAAAGGLVG